MNEEGNDRWGGEILETGPRKPPSGEPENGGDPDAWSNATERRAKLGSII